VLYPKIIVWLKYANYILKIWEKNVWLCQYLAYLKSWTHFGLSFSK